jgi:hypothetical protein
MDRLPFRSVPADWRPKLRQLILWCLPALVVALCLRAFLTWQLPYGYIQFDSIDFLETPYYLLKYHKFVIQAKRSFLTPTTFAIPFYLHIPALILIPLAQHFLGLIQTFFVGALVRLWFARWRWFIIPVTLLLGISPWLLWYEHTLMGEAQLVFLLIAAALAGTLWARYPHPKFFVMLWLTLFLAGGARGEGKLFVLFGVLLVPLILWQDKKWMLIHLGASVVLALIIFKGIRSPTNASANLYASLIHMAPDHFKSNPEIEPYLKPIRDKVLSRSLVYPADSVRVAKDAQNAVDAYADKNMPGASLKNKRRAGAKILNRLSLQILFDHPGRVLAMPLLKWRLAVDSWMSGGFDAHFLHEKQKHAVDRDPWVEGYLGKGLTGHALAKGDFDRFIDEHYDPSHTRWFDRLAHTWNKMLITPRTPDHPALQRRWVHDYIGGVPGGRKTLPGVPIFYIIAVAGMLVALFRRSPQREPQIAWAATMLIAWYGVLMVGPIIARYSFAYQPFCVIFFFAFFDFLASLFKRRSRVSDEPLRSAAAT